LLERHGASAEFGGEGGGAFGRTVGDGDFFDTSRLEGAGRFLAGFTRANDENFMLRQR